MVDNTVDRLTSVLRRMAFDFEISAKKRIRVGTMARRGLRESIYRDLSEGKLTWHEVQA